MPSAANPSSRFGQVGFGLSIVVHVGAFFVLTVVPHTPAPAPLPSVVEFEVAKAPEPPPPAPPEPPPPQPEPLPLEPASVRTPTPEQAAPPPEAAPEPEPPAGNPPVADLTGLTLTNDAGSGSWGSQVGNGAAMDRPIRAGAQGRRPAPAAANTPAPAVPARAASNVVPLADLSSRPVPPKLDGILEQHYPEIARQQGKSGTAIVRLRIDADGRVRTANIVSESETGFGRACHATVMGSKWSAPKDQSGNAVATFVSYTCRFRSNM